MSIVNVVGETVVVTLTAVGPQGPAGAQGEVGPPGPSGGTLYVHTQSKIGRAHV